MIGMKDKLRERILREESCVTTFRENGGISLSQGILLRREDPLSTISSALPHLSSHYTYSFHVRSKSEKVMK